MKALGGKLAYVVAGARALLGPKASLGLTVDGKSTPGGAWVVVCRSQHYGGPYVMHQGAGLERSDLGVVSIPAYGIVPFLGGVGLGLKSSWGVACLELGRHIQVTSPASLLAQVDGDLLECEGPCTEFVITVAPQAIRLRFPVSLKA